VVLSKIIDRIEVTREQILVALVLGAATPIPWL